MVMEKQNEKENMMGKGRSSLGRLDMMNKGLGGHHAIAGRPESVLTFMRWSLLPVMLTGQPNVLVGSKSQEKHTQAARQTSTMPAFFHPSTLPETPSEPDPELVVRAEPKEVPLNDVLGQDNLHDHRDKFWPEPLLSEPPPPYPPYPMGSSMPGGAARGGVSHWVIGGGGPPPAPNYGGGPMYGGGVPMPVGPGGPGGPCGYGGPAGYGGDMGEPLDGWGGPGPPDYPDRNMMMMGGGQNVMMGGHPNMGGPRNMMPPMGMGGGPPGPGPGPRFRGRQGGGSWNNSGRPPPVCRHFMNGHCKHGKSCKYLHPSPH
ncbi:hypothetical protein GWK47_001704 [Chionoecetes opilio]|uniref:C3H1-type domain-containing protein n=1 Tax=Chionoecetes opilio TaxID=41210 RepID=A0A8J5CIJ5_CHIOP|nr:hypothetical protein GWK47_001704 [Chionoecetes opilio]